MKKHNKPKAKVIKELATQFDNELHSALPVVKLSGGAIGYKEFLIKKMPNGNWGIYQITNKDFIEQFFLKSCALMAAKAYSNTRITKFSEIKQLDNKYWASYSDNQVYKNNIKTAKEFDRYMILLNKLEQSEAHIAHFKDEISRMFKWSFV
jgi:hypothetical protein